VSRVQAPWRAIPGGVWALGFVSLFMDISSELVHSLLPVFMVTVLGASAVSVGVVEGVAEATASLTKVVSGWVSDRLGRRKPLAVLGYGLAAVAKPLFALAPTVGWVLAARVLDRVGKGVRGAPRDALVGDLAPLHLRGASYGLRQSLDSLGAFAGPVLAIALMATFANDMRTVFWFAVAPAVISVAVLCVWVREPQRPRDAAATPIRLADLGRLGADYWGVVAVGAALALARFSEAFLVLRVADVGLALAWVPMVVAVMSAVYSASALPAGILADRIDRRALLALGCFVLIVADIVLAATGRVWPAMIGVGLWGLHMGLTQGVLATLVAQTAPAELRASAFGLFNLVSGGVALAASILAGVLWDRIGPEATFLAGAGFTVLALLGLVLGRGASGVTPPPADAGRARGARPRAAPPGGTSFPRRRSDR
jgi:MFS family permease